MRYDIYIYVIRQLKVKAEQFLSFYATPGQRFLAGGDYNAKHCHWGSELITPKGRELSKAMQKDNLSHVSTEEPTYWPSDRRKVPDLIDFGDVKRIAINSKFHCFTVHFDSLSLIHTNSCTFSYNYVSDF